MAFHKVTDPSVVWEFYKAGLLYEHMGVGSKIEPAYGWGRESMEDYCKHANHNILFYLDVEE